jgi:hypothetical protein
VQAVLVLVIVPLLLNLEIVISLILQLLEVAVLRLEQTGLLVAEQVDHILVMAAATADLAVPYLAGTTLLLLQVVAQAAILVLAVMVLTQAATQAALVQVAAAVAADQEYMLLHPVMVLLAQAVALVYLVKDQMVLVVLADLHFAKVVQAAADQVALTVAV